MELVPDDYVEYTCDVYFDKHSRLKCLVPRERLEVRAGEVSKAVTRMDFVYDRLLPKLSRIKQARGPITLQCFVHKQRQDIQLLEINPRFGGGYPLTEESGVSYVTWLLQEYLGEKELDFRDDWLPNNFMLRYDSQVIVRNA